jgi:MFS family permease
MAACQYGPILFLSIWGGAIADRVDKRKMLLFTQSLEMTQSASLAILAFMPHPPIVGLYLLALCGGIFLAFDNPLRRSFVSEMVPKEDIPNAVILYSLTINIARIFGPTLAGLLIITIGYGWGFTLDALSYIAVIISLVMMHPEELHKIARNAETTGSAKEGIMYIFRTPILWITFVMLAAMGTLSYNFTVTLPLFVTDTLHGSSQLFTVLYSIFSIGAVSGAVIVAQRNMIHIRYILSGALFLGITMLMLAAVPTIAIAFPVAFLVGITSILYMTATTAIVQTEAKHEMHGRVLALQTVLLAGTTPIGGPILGWLADVTGGRTPLLLGGVVCLLSAVFGYYATQRYIYNHSRV